MMRRIIGSLLFLAAGALAGTASAVWAIELYGAGEIAPGNGWQSWNVSSVNNDHPYSIAHFLMAGRFPPASGQMREFSAQRSSDGRILSAGCDYVLAAKSTPGGWWSVAAYASGVASPPLNSIITSDTAIAEHDGSLRLTVSRVPAGGNWLRPPVSGGFVLLYTVAEPSPSQSHGVVPQFAIERGKC
jgi:hypothetical protein